MRDILFLALFPAIKISTKEPETYLHISNKNLLANIAGGEGLFRDPMEVLGKYL